MFMEFGKLSSVILVHTNVLDRGENMRRSFIASWLTVVPLVSNFAFGEEPVLFDKIQVIGARVRLVSYQQTYDLARKVQTASGGRVALGLRLIATRPDVRLDDLRLSLDGDTESLPIPLREGEIFIVPVNDRIAQENGSYSVNKKKGDISVRPVFLPVVGKTEWTIGLMRQVVASANNSIGVVVPWYMRPFMGQIDSVAICTKEAGVSIPIMNGDDVVSLVNTEKKDIDEIGRTVFCKCFNDSDKFEDSLRVVLPEGAEVLLL